MSFGFHNVYHLDYQTERDKKDFMRKLDYLAQYDA